MDTYKNKSLEELRLEDYKNKGWGGTSQTPTSAPLTLGQTYSFLFVCLIIT